MYDWSKLLFIVEQLIIIAFSLLCVLEMECACVASVIVKVQHVLESSVNAAEMRYEIIIH